MVSVITQFMPSSDHISKVSFALGAAAVTHYSYTGISIASLSCALGSFVTGWIAHVRSAQEILRERKERANGHLKNYLGVVKQSLDSTGNNYSEGVKSALADLFEVVKSEGVSRDVGDESLRTKYVPAQASLEHSLVLTARFANITQPHVKLVSLVLTPTPCTPACALPKGEISLSLFDQEARANPAVYQTVADRTVTIRRLAQEGVVYLCFQHGGKALRKPEEQQILNDTIAEFPNMKLVELACDSIDKEKIGAYYRAEFSDGTILYTYILAPQVNAPANQHRWEIRVGTQFSDDVAVQNYHEVLDYISRNGFEGIPYNH